MRQMIFGVMALAATAAIAQAPATAPLQAGAVVVGKDNKDAGVISQVNSDNVVIDTGTHKVAVTSASIGRTGKGLYIGLTKAELDATAIQAAQQAQVDFAARLTTGASVNGLNGAAVGTIKSIDGDVITMTTPSGDVRLPRNGFGSGPDNTVRIGLTQEQLAAAIAASAGSPQ